MWILMLVEKLGLEDINLFSVCIEINFKILGINYLFWEGI